MPLSKRDREFRLTKISYLDFKQIEMDRVLTAFFARLAHKGYPSRLRRSIQLTTEAFVDEFLTHPEWFTGFAEHRDILERWVETHLMDVVNRGKSSQAIAAPRPLHGYTYRFRNPKHSRDYGAAQHLYEMLYHARDGAGQRALEHLETFFFHGHDKVTGLPDSAVTLDVETQALLRLLDQVEDTADTREDRGSFPPLCVGAADLLADDVTRLLCYERFIPRSVMVDYLKVLFSFHLALYHLRLLKLLPALVRRRGGDPTCGACPVAAKNPKSPHGDCQYQIGLLVDVAAQPGTPMSYLAERSADLHYRRIPAFVKAYFATRKLDEFATYLARSSKLPRPPSGDFSVGQVLALLGPDREAEREKYFGQRVISVEDTGGATDGDLDPELTAVRAMGLSEFDTYIEMLVAVRGRFHRQYLTECLDSLLLKNRPGALITQPRAKNSARRFILDSRLLEVLLQIAVLRPGGVRGYHTGELRIDELLAFLRERYGLHIDRLPPGDGFGSASITDQQALRGNLAAFRSRLREVGFYRDLSDAYVTQTVTPRYRIDISGVTPKIPTTGGVA
ncbi:methylation-associated defense system protein MAD7 [Verrucosispora sp. WMMD703]|uniref:methylation-associated defense system protein MAD7 n=1 Tax=Verrucosispora sp. WMMD703 TaxID=3403463 RepID=UPI003B9384D0